MTSKTIPERIFVAGFNLTDLPRWSASEHTLDNAIEYVCADLAAGAHAKNSEEWAEGEYRWVKIESEDNPWELAQAYYDPFMSPDMKVSVDNSLLDISEVAVFGPLIRPPKDM